MARRSDAEECKRHSTRRLLDLDRKCDFGGAGWQSDWERVRSGADRGQRQREKQGRIGKKWGFGRKGLGSLSWRHFGE